MFSINLMHGSIGFNRHVRPRLFCKNNCMELLSGKIKTSFGWFQSKRLSFNIDCVFYSLSSVALRLVQIYVPFWATVWFLMETFSIRNCSSIALFVYHIQTILLFKPYVIVWNICLVEDPRPIIIIIYSAYITFNMVHNVKQVK